MGKRDQKRKGFFDQVTSMFESNKAKADNPNRDRDKDDRPSIAERINFGGKGDQLKRDRMKRNKGRR